MRLAFSWLPLRPLLPCACAALLVSLVGQAGTVVRRAGDVDGRARELLEEVLADQAVFDLVAGGPGGVSLPGGPAAQASWHERTGTDGVQVVVRSPGRTRRFEAPVFDGRPPAALGHRLVVGPGADLPPGLRARAVELPGTEFPELDDAAVRSALRRGGRGLVRRHDGIAALCRGHGTDRADHVLSLPERSDGFDGPRTVVVDGHLFVRRPVRLELARDLLVAVRGNVYLHDDVEVRGGGRLVLMATVWRSSVFRDRDGDGYLGAGDRVVVPAADPLLDCREGTGAVHLEPGGGTPLRCQATVVAQGEVRVHGDVEVAGAVITRLGIAGAAPRLPAGHHPWHVRRGGLHGLRTRGAPRPGLLRPVR